MAFNFGISSGTDALSNAVSSIGTSAAAGAPAPTTAGGLPSFDASSYGLGSGKTSALDKFAGIIESGGTLKPGQEAKLAEISNKAGLDFASTLGYTPTSGRYDYTAPTNASSVDVSNLRQDDIRQAGTETGGVSAEAYTQNLGMVENPWTASVGDMYQNLNPQQENKFNKFAGMYAESLAGGDPLGQGKLNKLDKFLDLAGLGTRESYFAQPTYTGVTPEDFTKRTGGNLTYESLANLYQTADPIMLYAAAQKYGITPEEVQAALGGYSKSYYAPNVLESDIEARLASGKTDFQDFQLAAMYYKDPNNEMFADPNVRSRAETALYTYQNPITEPITATTTNRRGKDIASSGQYGYLNNAPILNAEVFDQIIGDRNRIGNDALRSDLINQLGWNFQSGEDLSIMQKGVRVIGLNEKQYTPEALAAMDAGQRTVDEATGIEYDPYEAQRNALVGAAEKVGLDPSQYESSADLYRAVEMATQDLYQVVGGYKNQWADEAAGLDDKGNHANVIYRNVNGQLIPIAADLFKYERPKSSIIGGTVGEILGSVPFLPEIAGFATGNPYIYAGLKGAQTASRPGADFGDIAVSTALAYYTPMVAQEISSVIGNFLPTEFVTNNPALADYITKAGTNISMNLATSALRGQDVDIGELVMNSLLTTGVQVGAGELLKLTDFPPEMQNTIANIVSRVAGGADIQDAVKGTIMRIGVNAIRNRGATNQGGQQAETTT